MHTDRCGNTRRQKCCAKYKSLCIEIQRMWNLKCTIVQVVIGATGIVTRSLKKNLETIPGNHSIDSLQKTTTLGTSHIIRKVLQCEAWSLSGADHRWFKRSTRKKCLWQETCILYNNNNNNNNNSCSPDVAQVLSEWYWNGSSRPPPLFYRYHFCLHIPHTLNFYYEVFTL